MAGETAKTRAVCLRIAPWSMTSHVVSWLSPEGVFATSVKGAMRPKSAFLGQYDLNYTCEVVYYLGARGGLHALRECAPLEMRDALRGDWRRLAAAGHMRAVAGELAPPGPDAGAYLSLLEDSLDALASGGGALAGLLSFEISALRLAGLDPAAEADGGFFALRGERRLAVSPEAARCIADPQSVKDPKILLDAARAIGVFYTFHLDRPPSTRSFAYKAAATGKTGKEN